MLFHEIKAGVNSIEDDDTNAIAGITVNGHTNRIEVYGDTLPDAIALRDAVLDVMSCLLNAPTPPHVYFDYEAAFKGEAVETTDGKPVVLLTHQLSGNEPLLGIVKGDTDTPYSFSLSGYNAAHKIQLQQARRNKWKPNFRNPRAFVLQQDGTIVLQTVTKLMLMSCMWWASKDAATEGAAKLTFYARCLKFIEQRTANYPHSPATWTVRLCELPDGHKAVAYPVGHFKPLFLPDMPREVATELADLINAEQL